MFSWPEERKWTNLQRFAEKIGISLLVFGLSFGIGFLAFPFSYIAIVAFLCLSAVLSIIVFPD